MAAAGPRRPATSTPRCCCGRTARIAVAAQLSLVASLALAEALVALGAAGCRRPAQVAERRADRAAPRSPASCSRARRAPASASPGWSSAPGVNIASAPGGHALSGDRAARRGVRRRSTPLRRAGALSRARSTRWLARWRAAGFAAVRPAWLRARLRHRRPRSACASGARRSPGASSTSPSSGALLVAQDGGRRREIAAGDVFYPGSLSHGRSIAAARDRRRQHQHRVRALPRARARSGSGGSRPCASAPPTSTPRR